jgi:4-carboxymuconolactone decarboxylase
MSEVSEEKSEQRVRGERLFKEICGAPAAPIEAEFLDITIEHIFGEVWAREDIATRDQRLLTIAVLTTLGEVSSLEIHMKMALESGDLSEEELHAAVIHLAHYAGWPRGSAAFTTLARAIAAHRSSPA